MTRRPAPHMGEALSRERAATIDRAATSTASRTIRYVASDETVDRYGDIIRAAGWKLENYRKNPVLMFGHMRDHPLPIGKVANVEVVGTQLEATAEFTPEGLSDFADECWRFVEAGYLNAVSVGFMPLAEPNYIYADDDPDHKRWPTGYEFVDQELLELSVVPVPANPQALAVARALAISEATQRRLFVADDRARARVAAEHRRRTLTLARHRPGFFNGGSNVA
jgi:phage head maturation protease